MQLEPRIFFMCDECEEEFDFEMTALAQNSWDARNVTSQMDRDGWHVEGDRHICPDCAHEAPNKGNTDV